jgi:transcriptional regulator with XRE-family HTH domain
MSFGEILREARKNAGLSLSKLAVQLGVTKVYVSDVERGLRNPFTQQRIRDVAEILNLDPTALSRAAAVQRKYVTLPTELCGEAKMRLAGSLGHSWPNIKEEHAVGLLKIIEGVSDELSQRQ